MIIKKIDDFVTLYCCRAWPCHFGEAFFHSGRCGLCGEIPEATNDPYIHANQKIGIPYISSE